MLIDVISMSYVSSFLNSLEDWVKMQRKMLETFKQLNETAIKGDRLELILATRAAFQHMIKTLRAFDQWLQDPLIISNMPKEFLEDVWNTTFKLLIDLIELDIRHTSAFKERAEKLLKEGKLSPVLLIRSGEEGAPRRGLAPTV